MIDQRLDFHIKIDSAELPENFCQDTFCEYSFMTEDGGFKTFKTIEVSRAVRERGEIFNICITYIWQIVTVYNNKYSQK